MNRQNWITPKDMEHVVLYRNDNEFSSWPFNAGMWKISENNILVGFMNMPCDYTNTKHLMHRRVEFFGRIAAVRSTDGGRTWGVAETVADNLEVNEQLQFGKEPTIEPHDFSDPNTLLCCWTTPNSGAPDAKAWVKLSKDAGQTWGPAVLLPFCNIPRFQGRSSYLVRPDGVILLFLTAKPQHNNYDRPVVYGSFDGGVRWTLLSYMPDSNEYRVICPSPIMLKDGTIVVGVRCKSSMEAAWGEVYASEDGGLTWQLRSRINEHGDTVHLTLLEDGRIFAVYGYRIPAYGIRAKISEDGGRTWGPELMLRDDGGNRDLGYPRATEVGKGEILATYYFNSKDDPIQMNGGGVRHIAGTILKV
ncbi:sialidase family protein [Paenibacillus radicis (ex Xue et al. 2023)]|uniref:Glycoside hydrolase n=1 Tax=Paenibacillus radicis (ex Xue et al. 2023) TaxID=2972489 RepID=A0ABT1YEH8_9BACL|nr:sialidase family protein [Paenibacillus radicis (ex Xue et al. 2023)]MCR8630628.1 glycoside hydrolase [Paenibacillus radicis (ex Xue et al. 2023)]